MRRQPQWTRPRAGLMVLTVLVAGAIPGSGPRTIMHAQAHDAFAQQPVTPGAPSPLVVGPLQLTPERVEEFLEADRQKLDYLPGEVLIRFKPGMGPGQQQRALLAVRSRPAVDDLKWAGGVARLRVPDQPNAHILADQLSTQPEVLSAEPNYIRRLPMKLSEHAAVPGVHAGLLGAPNDTDFAQLQWNFQLLDLPKAWDINPGGSPSLIVASVDTGVTVAAQTLTFPLFTGSVIQNVALPFAPSVDRWTDRIVSPHDFVFMGGGGPVFDMVGHGTHTSSTMAETTNNAFALAGIAYNVKLMPVKVCVGYWELMIANAQAGHTGFISPSAGGCTDDAINQGIRYAADNGAKVINLSFGGPSSSSVQRDAIIYAVQKGAFVSISMGNDGAGSNVTSFPAADAATIDGAMAVAAVGKSLARAYYSSTGPHCEIAAPGGSDIDGGVAPDFGFVWQVTLLFTDQEASLLIPRFDRYAEVGYEGTSMAAPHVAGLAALIMSQSPGITPAAVEALIKRTARHLGSSGRNNEFGFGLIQPRTGLFGFGIK